MRVPCSNRMNFSVLLELCVYAIRALARSASTSDQYLMYATKLLNVTIPNDLSMYDPNLHHRRSIRLKDYDYSQPGLYFITICCHHNKCRFGNIINGEMQLNEYGLIAAQKWEKLPEHYRNTELDIYQIMPNHIHSIVHITDKGSSLEHIQKSGSKPSKTDVKSTEFACGDIIGAYKSLVFNACLEIFKSNNQIMGDF